MDTRIKTIWTHYGQFNQLEKAIEELDELKAEVVKFLHFVKSTDNRFTAVARSKSEFLKDKVAEEAADVSIMIEQLLYGLNIRARFDAWKEYKLDRQIQRMERENEPDTKNK